MPIARRFLVTGRVQGVGFRYFSQRTALETGITGFVRNRRDGRVEALAEGAPDAVEAFAHALRQGPAGADVHSMDVTEVTPAGRRTFDVERTTE